MTAGMSPISKSMLEKYLRGECSPEEEAHVRHWFDTNDVDQYPGVMPRRGYARAEKKLWRRLSERLGEEGMVLPPEYRRPGRWLPYAAAILLLAGAFFIWRQTGGNNRWNDIVYSAGAGEIRSLSLPDGTEVVLNAMSEIRIRNDYGEEDRRVYLEGEAYFLVASDSLRAFIVYSNNIATTALGTIFNVSAYPGDDKTVVSLHEGRVSVNRRKKAGNPSQQLVLEPGEEAVCPGKGEIIRQAFNPVERLDWKDHVIYFERAGLPEVIQKLERYYGVDFDYRQLEGDRWELTGEYRQLPLKAILESLSFNYGIKYEIKENKVTLFK